MSSASLNRDLPHNETTNMKLFVASILFAVVAADRLDNTYLPPNSAKTAGGNGNFLSAPFGQANRASTGSSGRLSPPSTSYGIPTKATPFSNFGASSTSFGAPGKTVFGAPIGSSSSAFGKTQFGSPASQYGAPAATYGAPSSYSSGSQSAEGRAATLRFNNEHNGDGSYRFEFATENKIVQQEAGELKNVGTQQEGSVVYGSYSYLGDDGISYTVNYVADENGFRPSGVHIPTPPPVPAAIQKSLERNAALGGSSGYPSGPQGSYNQGGIGGQQGGQLGGFGGKQGGFGGNGAGFGAGQQGGFGGNGAGFGAGRPSAASRQYLAPNKPSFNQQTGYQY